MNRQHQSPGTLPQALRDALLRQLSAEQTWLQAARATLVRVRRCSVVGDLAELDAAIRDQAVLTATRDELAAARHEICRQVGVQLGMDGHAVTLGAIAARLTPEARQPVLSARRELAAGVRRVQALAAGAMTIIAHKQQIVDGVLGDWLGVAPTESRYTVDGRRQNGCGLSLLECRT